MGKTRKVKPACCGKFRKKNKHCSRCPVLFQEQCKRETIQGPAMSKKKEDNTKKKEKAKKALKKTIDKKGKKKDKKKKKKK